MEVAMQAKALLLAVTVLIVPASSFTALGQTVNGISCQDVRANPSLFTHKAINACRHAAMPLGYGGEVAAGPVTRNSSCTDVRNSPYNYSESVRMSCGFPASAPITDWGGGVVH